jgi:hypothetical protein
MAEREEEPDAHRPAALCEHLAGRVVDRGDVVGVECVPQPEQVRRQPGPGQRRIAVGVVEEERPADHVQEDDRSREPAETAPFGARETAGPPAGRHRASLRPGRA